MDRFLRRVVAGGGITLLSFFIMKIMTLVNSVVIARLLIPADYGAYSIIVNLQSVAVAVASFGVPLAIAKHVSQWNYRNSQMARAISSTLLIFLLVSAAITAIGLLVLSESIAIGLYENEQLVPVIRLSALFIFIASLNLGLSSVLQGCQKITRLAAINAFVAILAPPIAFASVSALGLEGAILALIFSNSISIVLLTFVIKRVLPVSFRAAQHVLGRGTHVRSLLSFTIPAFLGNLLVIPAYWVGKTELAIEEGFYSVGQFQIADSLSQLVMILPAAMSVPLLPLISELHAANPSMVEKKSEGLLKMVVFLALPSSILILPFLKSIITLLFGVEYEDAYAACLFMFAAATFIAVGSVVSNFIIGVGRMWDALGLNLLWLMLFMFLVFTLVPLSGAEGLAGAYTISYAVFVLVLLTYFRYRFGAVIARVAAHVGMYLPIVFFYVLFVGDEPFVIRFTFRTFVTVALTLVGYRFVLESDERRYMRTAIKHLVRRRD